MVLGDSFNNVIVCAETYNPGPLIGFVITKYDSAGNFLWQRRYDTPAQDILTAAVTDNTGAVYVGGNSTNSVTNKTETLIIKYAATGDTLWQYSLPVETSSFFNPSALLLDTQQNVLVFSNFIDASSGNSGLLIMKLNPDGNIIWTASYDEGNYGYIGIDARKVADRYVFWGQIGSSEGNRFFAWQVSDGGETLTTDSTDVYTESFGRGYFIDEFGSLFIGDQYYEYKVTKFDLDGSIDWVYNNPVLLPPSVPSAIDLQSIATTVTGEVLLAGVYNDTSGLIGLITKVSTAGEFLWEQKPHTSQSGHT